MSDEKTGPLLLDMNPEDFRKWGREAVDWAAGYLESIESLRVLPAVRPGDTRELLPDDPPEYGEPFDRMLADLDRVIVPGMTHWNHPSFFAYFSSSSSGPGIIAELLAATFNSNSMLWRTAPSATELEEVVLDWLRKMLGLPAEFKGIAYDTASVGTFHALAAARNAVSGWDVAEHGLSGPDAPRLCLYTSDQAHSSVEKGALAIGIGRRGVRKIPVDSEFRMIPERLERMIEQDRASGWTPFCVSATVGTTSTTSVDPVDAIAGITSRFGLWLHVDAAYAGAAAVLPERRNEILAGCERADSFVVNPHKWMFTPVELSAFFTRRPDALRRAFSLVPEYLKTSEDDSVTNFMDYGIQLGRRFRALKLWMVIRYFGVEGIRARIREHIRLAQLFASWIDGDDRFERLAPAPFSTVCFRLKGTDEENVDLLDRINASGKAFLSHTRLNGRFTIRFTVGNLRTAQTHVRDAFELIASLAGERPNAPPDGRA